jgi:hypothetical protein
MRTKVPNQPGWIKCLDDHREQCVAMREIVDQIEADYRAGNDIKAALSELRGKVRALQASADRVHDKMAIAPLRHMFSADRLNLTEKEYYLARAAGLGFITPKSLGVSPVTDFEVYRLSVYEDANTVCFMDPNENSNVETVDPKRPDHISIRLRGAISPEETERKYYRPEQEQFFAKHRPDVLSRSKPAATEASKAAGDADSKAKRQAKTLPGQRKWRR